MDGSDWLFLLLLFAIAYGMNVVPVLGPPVWTVVALFVVQFDLPLLPVTIGASFSAGWGRLTLSWISGRFGRSVIRAQQEDVDMVGDFIRQRRRALLPATFLYSIALPTSWLFMAAGIIRAPLRPIFLGYWLSRTSVDTLLVLSASSVNEEFMRGSVIGVQALVAQAFGIISFILFLRLPWVRWLRLLLRPNGGAAR